MTVNVRRAAFTVGDTLMGRRIGAHLADIRSIQSRTNSGPRRAELQKAIIHHATTKVPYYRRLGKIEALSDFPVVNKAVILANREEMIAEGYERSRLHLSTTSGSTGTPFFIYQDMRKRHRSAAETMHFGSLAGYEVGTRLYNIRVWRPQHRRSRIVQYARNLVPIEALSFDDKDGRELLDELERRGGEFSIVAYASALENIARAARPIAPRFRPRGRIGGVVAQSEALSDEVRKALRDLLGSWPVSRYGLEELGVVAQQQPIEAKDFLVNEASFVVEVMKEEEDTPARPGRVGRIVVTDLFNSAQPLIRYDTGDLGSFVTDQFGNVDSSRLRQVQGRRLDRLYDSQDNPLSPLATSHFYWRYPDVRQYQIIQRARADYLIRLSVPHEFMREDEFISDVRAVVGKDSIIDVERSDEGYVLASGKRKAVINHYHPE